MVLDMLKTGLLKSREFICRHLTGGADMDPVSMLQGAEPRRILQTFISKEIPAIMSYLSKGKWHVAKIQLTELGACRIAARVLPTEKPHPINIQPDQPVGVSLKYGYGKFIFESKVMSLEPSPDTTSGGTVALTVPDRIEIIQRRAYFRVDVPKWVKVNVLLWPRRQQNGEPETISEGSSGPEAASTGRYWQGRLVDVSAGGAQIAVDADLEQDFRLGRFLGIRFTPMPYEMPLVFDVQVRNMLPTADGKTLCLGLQIVGLEASDEGRHVLQRLCNIVERYYKMNQSGVKRYDFQATRCPT
jgi:hypothetical protein